MSEREDRSRLSEIMQVLRRYRITKGITPVKVREILEELGPTYVKLGQILSIRTDLISSEYCKELQKLRSQVSPMPYDEVRAVLYEAYKKDPEDVFASIVKTPIGSASIAQVHEAFLKSGEHVVLKVQRRGIYGTMERDVAMMQRMLRFVPPALKGLVDLERVISEFWSAAKEEMDFLREAANMETFSKNNENVVFVASPKLYSELTTAQVLVMEYIDGYSVSDTHTLEQEGYDLVEIGEKLADNYVRQIMQDGFFHADPHPGNLRIRGGKIVWFDMGMMGRLTPRDKSLIAKAVKAIARGNNSELVDVILALGIFHGKPNRIRLYTDIEGLMTRYGTMDIGSIDIAALLTELIEIMSANELAMPAQLTLLARGMTTIEGVIADLSPQVNIVEVASGRISASFWENVNWKEELKNEGSQLYRSINRAMDIPVLMADLLQSYRNNETRIKLDLHATEDLSQMLEKLVSKMVMGLVIAALLLASSILCTTQMQPHLFGIPALGFLGYIMALGLAGYLVWEHFKNKNANFSKVIFNVTDGYMEITPVADEVVVTIAGNNASAVYDGTEHKVTGYKVTGISNVLYTKDNFSFSGRNLKVNEARPREARSSYSRY